MTVETHPTSTSTCTCSLPEHQLNRVKEEPALWGRLLCLQLSVISFEFWVSKSRFAPVLSAGPEARITHDPPLKTQNSRGERSEPGPTAGVGAANQASTGTLRMMKFGVFTFAGVELPDRGAGPPAPVDRRFDNETAWETTSRLIELGITADRLGYESFWFTEHHFQYEGYEVTPNGLQLCTWLAAKTEQIRLGTMFNIVPQWNPLRLAEDFATLHNLSGGRGILGVGRGTVPREVQTLSPFGVSIGSHDNPDQKDADTINREVFLESMEIIKKALDNDTFNHHGHYFTLPPAGIPDRGDTVKDLTLVPRPLHPYEIWQAVTSPPTLETVPQLGHNAVFWLQHHRFIKRFWDRYAEVWESEHGTTLTRQENRMLVLAVRVGDTMEEAIESSRPGHDEFWKFLGPYGWSRGYAGTDGKPVGPGLIPTLEQSIENKTWVVGTADHVAEQIAFYRDEVGVENLTLFPQFAGDPFELAQEQLHRFKDEVSPLL